MKNLARFGLAVSLFLICSHESISQPSELEDRWLNGSAGYARAVELQRELNVPLIVYFYADWCPYCHALDGEYLPSAPVQEYLHHVVKVRINPEHGRQEQELAARYGLTGYPTFLVIRTASSRPLNITPFRKSGANLTPAQFADACRQAAPVLRKASTESRANRFPGRIEGTPSRQSGNVQLATVAPSRTFSAPPTKPALPELINETSPPTLDQILTRYIDAMGGRDAQMRLTSRVAMGSVDLVGISNGGRLKLYAAAPNKSLLVMEIDSVGVMRRGFDGRMGWEQSDQSGLRIPTGAALVSFARDAEFYRELKLKELYDRIRLIGRSKHGFREVYLVEASPREGEPEMLYFDTDTGLLVRRDVTRSTSHGPVRAEIYFSDWHTVDGVKLPFKTTQIMSNQTFVFTLQQVKHNVPVDESIFRKPAK